MKKLLILTFLIAFAACKTTKADLANLNGDWIPVRQEIGGKDLSTAFFENQRLNIEGKKYTVYAESFDQGEVTYANGKMDIYGKKGPNAGKHFTAIYKYENKELTVCYDLSGKSYPAAFETKSKPTLFLSVFKSSK